MNATLSQYDRELDMFNCSLNDLQAFCARYIGEGKLFTTPAQAAVSLMSDAQEEVTLGRQDMARKTLNRAKWLLAQRA